jgi:hypothetical protein
MRGELGQQFPSALLCRLAEERSLQPESGANCLLDQVHAFDGAMAVARGSALGEGAAQLFDQRMLAAGDRAQAVKTLARTVCGVPGHQRMIRERISRRSRHSAL